ncbi:MAG: FGGY-family carbohydrate kinase [Candidatus Odinarchaeota archaeon]
MDQKYIISHDMGTSSNKAVLLTVTGEIIDHATRSYPTGTIFPQPGYAEQVPDEYVTAIIESTRELMDKTDTKPEKIAGITFCTQMQGFIAIDKDGTPLTNNYNWLDSRGAANIHAGKHKLYGSLIKVSGYSPLRLWRFLRITGGVPGQAGKDQVPKVFWLLDNHPEIYEKTYKFLDAKDYVIFKLTGNIMTSSDLAVLWWLLDTRKKSRAYGKWSKKLCKMLKLPGLIDKLPEVRNPADIAGTLLPSKAKDMGLSPETPVINGVGDMTAAATGSGALAEGELHISVGTSGWVIGHVTQRKLDLFHYTGCAGSAHPDKYYLAIGHQETAAGAFEWLMDKILYYRDRLREEAGEEEGEPPYALFQELASTVPAGSNGLIFTPWLAAERCPLDDDTVRGGLHNINLGHTRSHLIRGVFEGVAYNLRWALETVENLYPPPVTKVNIIGGGAVSDVWCQIFADVFNKEVHRVENPKEAGAKGAALLASYALGFMEQYEDIKNYIRIDKVFKPNLDHVKLYNDMFKEFKNLYKYNRKFYKRMHSTAPN